MRAPERLSKRQHAEHTADPQSADAPEQSVVRLEFLQQFLEQFLQQFLQQFFVEQFVVEQFVVQQFLAKQFVTGRFRIRFIELRTQHGRFAVERLSGGPRRQCAADRGHPGRPDRQQ